MSEVIEAPVRRFLEAQSVGTLATIRPDGRARHTLVYFTLVGDQIRLSTEANRGKARDVARTGWASICVMAHARPWASCTVEGPARLVREGQSETMATLLEKITGTRPETPPSDAQLAASDRVLIEIDGARVYGVSYVD